MKTEIIACRTLEQELACAMEQTGCQYEIRWVEAGLHNVPQELNGRLQEILDRCEDCDTVLLAMSFCGNSLAGLQTGSFQLVVPRCDDCISLLLGSTARRREARATYFLTEGWLRGERNIWREYEYCMEKYGLKRGRRIFDAMFSHYQNLALVDTGCFDFQSCASRVRQIADLLGLEYTCIPGTLDYLKQLLSGGWSQEHFLVIPPHSTVSHQDCVLQTVPSGPQSPAPCK